MLKRRAMAFDGGEQPRRFVLCDQEAIIRVFAAPETPYEDRKQSAVTFDQRGNNPRETETSGHHEIDHFDAQQQQEQEDRYNRIDVAQRRDCHPADGKGCLPDSAQRTLVAHHLEHPRWTFELPAAIIGE